MPIRFRYHADRDLLVHVGEGAVTIADIENLRRQRREAGVPSNVRHTLTDMRRAQFVFDPSELKANEKSKDATDYAGTRHAEIVTDPHNTAILLLWQKWLPEGVEVHLFSEPESAYPWLGIEAADGDLDF